MDKVFQDRITLGNNAIKFADKHNLEKFCERVGKVYQNILI